MKQVTMGVRRLFGTLPGLLVVAVAWDALLVASLAPFSGPLRPLGLVDLFGVDLGATHRVARIIMLYHALAVPFVAALVYLVLDQVPMGPPEEQRRIRRSIVVPVTAGYMLTSVGGMTFAYGGRSWIAHGLFLVGLSLVFYAGVLLAVAMWPSRRWATDRALHVHVAGVPVERLAFFIIAIFLLVSAAFGGAAGAFFGNGFEAFLAEDIVREPVHSTFELMIIAHLHIMLTLIDVAILLLVIRFYRLSGWVQKAAVPMTLFGTIVITFAAWSVVRWEGAHRVINVGSAFLLPGAVLVAIWGFAWLMREAGAGASAGAKLKALLREPIRLGIFFELIFVNVVVTTPGVYVAFNLERYRSPAYTEVERGILVGHWHVLATLSAVVLLFLIADRLAQEPGSWLARRWVRQAVGWGLLAGSTLAFVFVNVYMFRLPGQEKAWTVPIFETGIALSLLALALWTAVALADRVKTGMVD
ncbi:MAG TPA: hypothetical protein VLC95_01755 [Anaerolineae bacterium]|nr:hypothetical protein [Anaerolineae bacterium]